MTAEQYQMLIMPMRHKIYRLAHRLLQDIEEAEDVVQEVMIRLWDRRDQVAGYSNPEAFAMTVTKNLSLDKLRTQARRPQAGIYDHTLQESHTPEKVAEQSDTHQMVLKLIGQLSDMQRLVIQLRDVEGLEFDEIEEITGMNKIAIRTNLSRARKKVREALQKQMNYEYPGN
ncbi:MAG: sigma-70 family RNA polymerase sigma factor [Bacteroidales bacterium]